MVLSRTTTSGTFEASSQRYLPVLEASDIPDLSEYPLLRAFPLQHTNIAEQHLHDARPVTHASLHPNTTRTATWNGPKGELRANPSRPACSCRRTVHKQSVDILNTCNDISCSKNQSFRLDNDRLTAKTAEQNHRSKENKHSMHYKQTIPRKSEQSSRILLSESAPLLS